MADDENDAWLTDRQAGLLLGRTAAAVLQLRLRGELTYLNSKSPRIRLSHLNAYVARSRAGDKELTPTEQVLLDRARASLAYGLTRWELQYPRAPRKRLARHDRG
jgi:hypothetical protein